MAEVVLDRLTKVFRDGTCAVRDLSLHVRDGELVVLVGPSGCGKSTTLRMIAGLEEPTEGTIHIGGRNVDGLGPAQRNVSMVFQTGALYPHKTVRENLGFALSLRKMVRDEIEQRVDQVARDLALSGRLDRRPWQLSGGERQRVAIGRAIVRQPAAFLMDEPLSDLDAALRTQLRGEIMELHQELGATTIYVTHDQVEAMTLGDRVAVMHGGTLRQVGRPVAIYNAPADTVVAQFFGSPQMNLFVAQLLRGEHKRVLLHACGGLLPVLGCDLMTHPDLWPYVHAPMVVGARPEAFALVPAAHGEWLRGEVRFVEFHGNETLAHVHVPDLEVVNGAGSADGGQAAADRDGPLGRHAKPQLLTVRVPRSKGPYRGEVVGIRVDLSQLHLFSAEGDALAHTSAEN